MINKKFFPKVSVVMPIKYCSIDFLVQSLESLFQQTMRDFELLCIDMGARPETLDLLKEYEQKDDRIKIITHKWISIGAARNYASLYAVGEYLFFLNPEDTCDPELFAKVVESFEECMSDIVVFNYHQLNQKNLVSEDIRLFEDISINTDSLISSAEDFYGNKMYRRSFLRKNTLRFAEEEFRNDYLFFVKALMNGGKVSYLNMPLMTYRTHYKIMSIKEKEEAYQGEMDAILEFVVTAVKRDEHPDGIFMNYIIHKLKEEYLSDVDLIAHEKIDGCFSNYLIQLYKEIKEKYRFFEFLRKIHKSEIIVSLTSFPKRIHQVYVSIESILCQSQKADKVILWLSKDQFPHLEADLPENLLRLCECGLDIEWCDDDLRPHKKYYYVMKKYPNAAIITVDDDLIYDYHMIEQLIHSYLLYPKCVSAMRTHLIKFDENGAIAPYKIWEQEYADEFAVPSYKLFCTTGAGTLFPPHIMNEETFNIANIKKLCLNADDLWMKLNQMRQHTKVVLATKKQKLKYVDGTQEIALYKTNVSSDNDIQLQNLLSEYNFESQLISMIRNEKVAINLKKKQILEEIQEDYLYKYFLGKFKEFPESEEYRKTKQLIINKIQFEEKMNQLRERWQISIDNILNTIDHFVVESKRFVKDIQTKCYKTIRSFYLYRAVRDGIKYLKKHGISQTIARILQVIRGK